jgi:ubiquinone/menaquinone biosynthesis C-methylase UbiE
MDGMTEKVRKAWDDIFAAEEARPPRDKDTGIAALDDALDWLCKRTRSVIDFGCGNGSMLMLCALRGTKQHTGVDFSAAGIRLARESAALMKRGQFTFIEGGPDALLDIKAASQDAAILSNIADNLAPEDALAVLDEIRRIVKPGGRVLVSSTRI